MFKIAANQTRKKGDVVKKMTENDANMSLYYRNEKQNSSAPGELGAF